MLAPFGLWRDTVSFHRLAVKSTERCTAGGLAHCSIGSNAHGLKEAPDDGIQDRAADGGPPGEPGRAALQADEDRPTIVRWHLDHGWSPRGTRAFSRRPGMSAREHRARAWETVGIDVEMASRLAREHARLQLLRRPTASANGERRARSRRAPARCAASPPTTASATRRLRPAAVGPLRGDRGERWARPATELAMTIAELTRLAGSVAPPLRARLRSFAWAAEDGIKCAFETNYAIFADLGCAWSSEEGIALRELCNKGEISRQPLSASRTSHAGAHRRRCRASSDRSWQSHAVPSRAGSVGDTGLRAVSKRSPSQRLGGSSACRTARHRARNVARAQSRLKSRPNAFIADVNIHTGEVKDLCSNHQHA